MMEGFKATKLGEIPNDWSVRQFKDVTETLTDYVASGSFASLKDNVIVYDEPNYAVYVRQVDLNSKFKKTLKYVDKRSYEFLKNSNLFKDDIIFTNIGDLGKISIMPEINQKATIAPNILLIRAEEEILTQKFYYYLLSSEEPQKEIHKIKSGTGLPKINKGDLKEIWLKIPPLPEQQKIAEILSTVDAKIDLITQRISQTQDLKKGLMQRLLTKGIGHTEFKDSPLGEIPKSWEVVKIGDFVEEFKGGASLRPSDFVEENGFPVIPKKAIGKGGLLVIDKKKPTYCSKKFAQSNTNYIVDKNFIITTLRDLVPSGPTIGYMVQYNFKTEYILAQGVYGFKINKKINKEFLIQYSNTSIFRKIMQKIKVGSTQVHIRNKDYFGVQIPSPSKEEQTKIASILSTVDEKLAVLQNKKTHYQDLKKGLMQQLLTGKVRVTLKN